MEQPIQIRTYKDSDLSAVLDLLKQLAGVAHAQSELTLASLQRVFYAMEPSPEFYMNLVAINQEQVCGFVSVIFYKTLFHKGGTALINELVVDQKQRGSGIGKTLIEAVITEARRRGMDEVEVGTEKDNYPAQEFYHRCGLTEEYLLLGMEFEE